MKCLLFINGVELNILVGIYARGYIPWRMECRGVLFDDFID